MSSNRHIALLAAATFLAPGGAEPSDVIRLAEIWEQRLMNRDMEDDREMRELGIRE